MTAGYSTQTSQILPVNNINIQRYSNWLQLTSSCCFYEKSRRREDYFVCYKLQVCPNSTFFRLHLHKLSEYTNWLKVLKKYSLAIAWVFVVSISLSLTDVVTHNTIWIQNSGSNWCCVLLETTGVASHGISIHNVKLKLSHYWHGDFRTISTWRWLRLSALCTGRLYPN
jgi:hypothetical protein